MLLINLINFLYLIKDLYIMRAKKSKFFLYISIILLVIVGYYISKDIDIKAQFITEDVNIQKINS